MIMIIPACIQNLKRHRMINKSRSYVRDSKKLEAKKTSPMLFPLLCHFSNTKGPSCCVCAQSW